MIITFAVENRNMIGGESRVGFYAHQQRTSSSGCHAFAWIQFTLEAQSKSTFLQKKRNTCLRVLTKILLKNK